ncbi:hypothetical protein CBS101457_006880 [Exobasidium rhododendri]|nr:hypothetical protein CBS101457_006880 [Exobasidium rhododendri]
MPEHKAAGEPVWAPSAIAARGGAFRILVGRPGYVTPTETKDPKELIQRFIKGAENAKLAGFDGVELHGANGYLPHEFLDSTSNKRTDEYGGSIPNRAKFILQTLQGLEKVFPGRVGIKLSPGGGYNDMGMPLEETIETFGYLLDKINAMGLAYVQLVRDIPFMDPIIDGKKRATHFDVFKTLGTLVDREKTALFLNGDISAEEGEELLDQDVGDMVVIGRPWISNPDYARRVLSSVPLNETSDPKYWQVANGNDAHRDYTNFPAAT